MLDRLLQSMETKKVYLWLLHVRRDEVERKPGGKLEKNEWIAIRVGNFSVEEVFSGRYPFLEIEGFHREICKPSKNFFWWDRKARDGRAGRETSWAGMDCPMTDPLHKAEQVL